MFSETVVTVREVVVAFLEGSLGEEPEGFTDRTPFMDAGLDSLDTMKVGHTSNDVTHSIARHRLHYLLVAVDSSKSEMTLATYTSITSRPPHT